MIIQGDNIIVNGNTTSGANIAKFDDYISVDANNRVSTVDMIATQSFRVGDDAHWKIRPNNGNQELCFEYSTSNIMSDANIKARFNSSGHFLNPNQPAFSAYHPAPTGQSNVVIYGSTRSNVGNCYSTSTGGFTAPVAGHYHFTYNALMQLVTGTPDYCRLYFDINGAHNATFGDTLAGGSGSTAFAGWNYISVTHSSTIYLNANDVVKVWNDGPAATYGTGYGTFSGFLIG